MTQTYNAHELLKYQRHQNLLLMMRTCRLSLSLSLPPSRQSKSFTRKCCYACFVANIKDTGGLRFVLPANIQKRLKSIETITLNPPSFLVQSNVHDDDDESIR